MIFTTWQYGLFLALTVPVFWRLPLAARPWWLIAMGVVFYADYFPPHLPLIVVATGLVYACARSGRRAVLMGGIVGSLGLLVYYKYSLLLLGAFLMLGIIPPAPVVGAVPLRAPLAISFFVFEFVHYLIEVSRGRLGPGRPRDFLLFVLFFPTMISGPIKRFGTFQPQVEESTRLSAADLNAGLERILVGAAKKLIVADGVHRLIGPLWEAPLGQPVWLLWLMTYGYALQILFDFSGYSDIAIGSARLFGFHVPENFDYPYLQRNIGDFWRAWHMSLTSWITDYVYIPLGGNRRGVWRTQWNRLIAMALCGLWHGAAMHFVLWGLYHGVGLNVYQAYRRARERIGVPSFGVAGRVGATLLTFHFVCVGWVLFVTDATTAQAVMRRLLGLP